MEPDQIAYTIAQQIGGFNRLKLMVGAYNFSRDKDGTLTFMFKMFPKANTLRIKLEPDDTYTMTFIKATLRKGVKEVQSFPGVYCDDLARIFMEFTGLELRIPRIVGINA